jgi:hypothetical protein
LLAKVEEPHSLRLQRLRTLRGGGGGGGGASHGTVSSSSSPGGTPMHGGMQAGAQFQGSGGGRGGGYAPAASSGGAPPLGQAQRAMPQGQQPSQQQQQFAYPQQQHQQFRPQQAGQQQQQQPQQQHSLHHGAREFVPARFQQPMQQQQQFVQVQHAFPAPAQFVMQAPMAPGGLSMGSDGQFVNAQGVRVQLFPIAAPHGMAAAAAAPTVAMAQQQQQAVGRAQPMQYYTQGSFVPVAMPAPGHAAAGLVAAPQMPQYAFAAAPPQLSGQQFVFTGPAALPPSATMTYAMPVMQHAQFQPPQPQPSFHPAQYGRGGAANGR